MKNEIKILQYADDLILTLANEESLRKCLKIVREFSEIAGPVLNINKSEIIGTCQYKTLSEIGNIKTTDNANCLGIYVGHDKTVCDQKNWYDKIEKLQSTLATWSKRNLTIFGSVTIIKALAISKVKLLQKINNVDIDYIKNVTSLFYKQIVTSYISTKSLDESSCVTCDNFLNQPLWGNDMFMVHRKKMFIQCIYLTGLKVALYILKILFLKGLIWMNIFY